MSGKNKISFVDLKASYRSIKDEVNESILQEIAKADYILGESVDRFEQDFAQYCRTSYCVGVDNGTSALFLALLAAGIGEGDEVITVANSFIATALAIKQTGATPVFIDSNEYFLMDTTQLEAAITKRTRAIIPVHLYGQLADMEEISRIAKEYHLAVIEDSAQAHGATQNGRKAGSLGDMACFSFYPTKNLGAYGDAGAVITNNPVYAQKLRQLRNYGSTQKYHHPIMGFNHRLDSLQAAILSVKLTHLDNWNRHRRQIARIYDEALLSCPFVTLPKTAPDNTHTYYIYALTAPKRDVLQSFLQNAGIQTLIHYPTPIHLQPLFKKSYGKQRLPNTVTTSLTELSLPMYPELTETKVRLIAETITSFYKRNRP